MSLIPTGFAKSASAGGFYSHPIEQSLRFNDNDSAYLSWTPATTGDTKTWTFSCWFKRSELTSQNPIFTVGANNTNDFLIYLFQAGAGEDTIDIIVRDSSTIRGRLTTTQVFRDPSAWYHLVFICDTTDATSSDRLRLYINGERVTDFSTATYPSQNQTTVVNNSSYTNYLARLRTDASYYDGYMAEVHFIDGTALDPTSFGETKSGVWIPKAYSGSYGTNGFYLPFNHDYSVEGFSATTYTGNGGTQYIGGVGFEPDLVWIKNRSAVQHHNIFDSVRGNTKLLYPNLTDAEATSTHLTSFDSDGFTLGSNTSSNGSGHNIVAWCWDAGSGSPVSNTDGSITSTVKASTTYGFSIVSWTGDGGADTIGHGLSSAPELIISKTRNVANSWTVYSADVGNDKRLILNATNAAATDSAWNNTTPTSSVFSVGSADTNGSGYTYIAYCFHSVSGYSKIGSYTGTGASGNSVTTGFKPAFLLVKRTDTAGESWAMMDNVRDVSNPRTIVSFAERSDAEQDNAINSVDFDATGFTVDSTDARWNASGGNYIYMAFADKREAAFWLDQSGNNNDFENNNLTESDISLDSPTNNFATLNPLHGAHGCTLSEGNLYVTNPDNKSIGSGLAVTSGKWMAEVVCDSASYVSVGVCRDDETFGTNLNGSSEAWMYSYVGTVYKKGVSDTAPTTFTTGDIITLYLDLDNQKLYIYKNNSGITTSEGTHSVGSTGLSLDSGYGYYFCTTANGNNALSIWNFGQDSSFAGNKTAQGNTDDNGYGDFYYAPPTGYLALCTANLTVPDAMNPALDASPQDYFNTIVWTGDGTTSRSMTGVGFQPDFVWNKERTVGKSHQVYDAVRGAGGNCLVTNATTAEGSVNGFTDLAYGYISSFDADGFTTNANTANSYLNYNGRAYVAWNWKANGSGVSNTDGSITSTVSANTDAGFSIVSYTGNGTDNATTGHGLSQTPDLVFTKNRDTTAAWLVTGNNGSLANVFTDNYHYLYLNGTDALGTASSTSTVHGSSVLTFADSAAPNNNSSQDYIAYCFHSVEGFSKFGSYTGNGSADNAFVYTGFAPAFVIIKKDGDGNNWLTHDIYRDTTNQNDVVLFPNSSSAEATNTGYGMDMLSNGFKIRASGGEIGSSGGTYIFMAFSSNPFKYSTAV
jgi:hypothetical protein